MYCFWFNVWCCCGTRSGVIYRLLLFCLLGGEGEGEGWGWGGVHSSPPVENDLLISWEFGGTGYLVDGTCRGVAERAYIRINRKSKGPWSMYPAMARPARVSRPPSPRDCKPAEPQRRTLCGSDLGFRCRQLGPCQLELPPQRNSAVSPDSRTFFSIRVCGNHVP